MRNIVLPNTAAILARQDAVRLEIGGFEPFEMTDLDARILFEVSGASSNYLKAREAGLKDAERMQDWLADREQGWTPVQSARADTFAYNDVDDDGPGECDSAEMSREAGNPHGKRFLGE